MVNSQEPMKSVVKKSVMGNLFSKGLGFKPTAKEWGSYNMDDKSGETMKEDDEVMGTERADCYDCAHWIFTNKKLNFSQFFINSSDVSIMTVRCL